MIPLIAAGIGLLIGGGTVLYVSEREKAVLRRSIRELEESNAALEKQQRAAVAREIKQRFEILRLTLEWSKSRYTALLEAGDLRLDRLERVWSVGRALQQVVDNLPASGVLAPADQAFVDVVIKAQRGEKLTRVDQARIEDYLDAVLGDQRRNFLEDRLASAYKHDGKRVKELRREVHALKIEGDALERRERINGLSPEARAAKVSRIPTIEREIEELERRLASTEKCLVVLTRVSRPEDADDEDDRVARELVQRIARGARLSEEESDFLDYYRRRYFAAARKILLVRREIDLADQASVS